MTLPPVTTAITSAYGERRSRHDGRTRMHWGVDFGGELDRTPVMAIAPGRVVVASANGARGFGCYGRVVVVHHPALQVWTMAAHLARTLVEPGEEVGEGEILGYVGNSNGSEATPGTTFRDGRCVGGRLQPLAGHAPSGPHLHWEVAAQSFPMGRDARRLDPIGFLEANGVPFSSRRPGGRALVTAPDPSSAPPDDSADPPRVQNPPPAPSAGASALAPLLGIAALFFGLRFLR